LIFAEANVILSARRFAAILPERKVPRAQIAALNRILEDVAASTTNLVPLVHVVAGGELEAVLVQLPPAPAAWCISMHIDLGTVDGVEAVNGAGAVDHQHFSAEEAARDRVTKRVVLEVHRGVGTGGYVVGPSRVVAG